MDVIHKITLRSRIARLEVLHLLQQIHGIEAELQVITDDAASARYVLTFTAPKNINLDFLRPTYLPPKKKVT